MAAPLIFSISDALVSFGKKPLFENLSFNIHLGDKICLIGKNGAGKTTLMSVVYGGCELDSGKRWQALNLSIGYLPQEVEVVSDQTVFDYIFSALPLEKQNEENIFMVESISHPLQLHLQARMNNLSGGELRRAALARSLVLNPDLLLLDEPTNHLDFEGVQWLENYLKSCRNSVICISHDRTFLKNISNKVFWLDRGKIRVCPQGYGYFENWSQMLLEQERRELENRQRIFLKEEEWAARGIPARRKRNQKRLENLRIERQKLRSDKSLFAQTMKKIELDPLPPEMSSKLVAEFIKVSKSFNSENKNKIILDKFNLRVLRGDKIGILGKNGSGKTSFLKLLIGEMTADAGKVKLARDIQISYFDQKRSNLNPNQSIRRNLVENSDYLEVMGKTRHVCGYLKDFLFDPKDADDLAGTLSGGQKNRLMLAKALANPGNCLILDEPTNDLDMDTLDILEDILSAYTGTLFVVSHDRDFLDQTVNKILVFEGEGKVEAYIGGYSDYLLQIGKNSSNDEEKNMVKTPQKFQDISNKKSSKKLSYKLQYELDNLPAKIDELNQELTKLTEQFSDATFFAADADARDKALLRSKEINQQLEKLEQRWLELEEMREN